jgi:translation elongation factor EF-1beta
MIALYIIALVAATSYITFKFAYLKGFSKAKIESDQVIDKIKALYNQAMEDKSKSTEDLIKQIKDIHSANVEAIHKEYGDYILNLNSTYKMYFDQIENSLKELDGVTQKVTLPKSNKNLN